MLFLPFILAMIPIIWLIIALCGLKMQGHLACIVALVIAAIEAIFIWKQGAMNTGTAALEGVLNALWPICLVIVAALFTYNMSLKTGAMDKIKHMLASVSADKRVLVLLIGWGFGNFMEGMAGFGTAVAIPASMLVGLGINPMAAVLACLCANTTPTAFGSVGIPTVTSANVTGIDATVLAGNIGILQCILAFITPFIMVCIVGKGIKALKGMIPTIVISSLAFTVPYVAISRFMGPELPVIVGSICSMVLTIVAARAFNKKLNPDYAIEIKGDRLDQPKMTVKDGVKAWSPFVLIFILLMVTSSLVPFIHDPLSSIKTSVQVYTGANAGTLSFAWINTPGVWIFISAIIGGFIQGARGKVMLQVFGGTIKKYYKTIITICAVMATAKIMSYSGMISDIAAFLVIATGAFYPFISPIIGALGAFVTGSGTSTSVLFGPLQSATAASLAMNPAWLVGANVMGAGIGKMICPQSIAIGAAAMNEGGSESKILRAVIKYFIIYLVIAGAITLIGAKLGLGF